MCKKIKIDIKENKITDKFYLPKHEFIKMKLGKKKTSNAFEY